VDSVVGVSGEEAAASAAAGDCQKEEKKQSPVTDEIAIDALCKEVSIKLSCTQQLAHYHWLHASWDSRVASSVKKKVKLQSRGYKFASQWWRWFSCVLASSKLLAPIC